MYLIINKLLIYQKGNKKWKCSLNTSTLISSRWRVRTCTPSRDPTSFSIRRWTLHSRSTMQIFACSVSTGIVLSRLVSTLTATSICWRIFAASRPQSISNSAYSSTHSLLTTRSTTQMSTITASIGESHPITIQSSSRNKKGNEQRKASASMLSSVH